LTGRSDSERVRAPKFWSNQAKVREAFWPVKARTTTICLIVETGPADDETQERWTAKGRATRAQIVGTTADLMYERGVAGTSTQDILRAANVSNSQLYHYFDDKDDLIRAVVAHQIERVLGRQETLLAGLDSFAALEGWRDALVTFASGRHGKGGCPIGSLASELADLDEPARQALAAGFDRWERVIRDGLTAMRDRGELRPDADPDTLALATLTALQGGLLLTQTRRDATPLATGLDASIAYIRTYATRRASRLTRPHPEAGDVT
jgi:TetR/AcrR family transcriptional repressor of nem operon